MAAEGKMGLQMVELSAVDPHASAIFGGKACGVARLLAKGARVPSGFAVQATSRPPKQWDEPARAEFCRRASQLMIGGPIVVRSSAVGEDGTERSFAGQFDTILGVTSSDQALAAAGRCIASAENLRVHGYAGDGADVQVGLVVQTQVDARAAGVCFTRDPLGKDEALIVEAVAGAGEALVSGRKQPQRWRLYRSGFGRWEVRRDDAAADPPSLTERELCDLVEAAARHAAHERGGLDLEWVVDQNGELWWLQARPITAAASPPRFRVDRVFDGVDDGPVTVWFNWNVRETMPDPVLPLTWSVWREAILPLVTNLIFGTSPDSPIFPHLLCLDRVHGRIYFNMNGILAWPLVRRLMTGSFMKLVDPDGVEVCRSLIAEGVLRARRLPGSRGRLAWDIARATATNTWRFAAAFRPARAMRRLRGFEVAMTERRRRLRLASMSDRQLLEEARLFIHPQCRPLLNGLHYETMAIGVYSLALRAFRGFPEAAQLLAVGIPDNPTTQISVGVDALIEAARPLAALFQETDSVSELLHRLEADSQGRAWLARLDDFLQRFGHRCPKEFDLGAPRWVEAPEMIIDLVRAGLAAPGVERLSQRLDRLAEQRRNAISHAVATAAAWRRPLLRALARLVEIYMPLREAPKHYAMFAFQRMREAVLELGDRLTARGHVTDRNEVFFLDLTELERLLADGHQPSFAVAARITERQAFFDGFLRERAPNYCRSDGVPIAESRAPLGRVDGVLRGIGGSTGRAQGPARILTKADPRAMHDGDVLVVEFADPGWTPLFPRASALIMEVGGLMCHAAVVARELGIPAVFGATGATRLLQDGQRVTVDGYEGTVTIA